MAGLNFAELTKPISADEPCGPDLEDDLDFMNATARLEVALPASYFRRDEGKVEDFMNRDVVSIRASASLIDAIELFLARNHHILPVVEGARLIGQISRHDILKGLEKVRRDER